MKKKLFSGVMTAVLSLTVCVMVLAAGAYQAQAAGGLFPWSRRAAESFTGIKEVIWNSFF